MTTQQYVGNARGRDGYRGGLNGQRGSLAGCFLIPARKQPGEPASLCYQLLRRIGTSTKLFKELLRVLFLFFWSSNTFLNFSSVGLRPIFRICAATQFQFITKKKEATCGGKVKIKSNEVRCGGELGG
jgi:hypothetical protein